MGHSDVKKTFGNLHCQIRCNFKDESLGKFLAIYCDMLDGIVGGRRMDGRRGYS